MPIVQDKSILLDYYSSIVNNPQSNYLFLPYLCLYIG